MEADFCVRSYKDTQVIFIKSNGFISVKFIKSLLYRKHKKIIEKLYNYNNRDINIILKNMHYLMMYKKDDGTFNVEIRTNNNISLFAVFDSRIKCSYCRFHKEINTNC